MFCPSASVRLVCPTKRYWRSLRVRRAFCVSFDRDYGELIFRRGRPPPRSVIYLRLLPVSPEEVADILLRILKDGAGSIDGRMVIVTRQGIRERTFPRRAP